MRKCRGAPLGLALAALALMPSGEAWAASKPNQTYDFSRTYLNSDLDSRFLEVGLRGRFQVREGLSVIGSYRYLDFEDDAPYLSDTTGSVDYCGLGLGWSF